jgi:hypothetical protein
MFFFFVQLDEEEKKKVKTTNPKIYKGGILLFLSVSSLFRFGGYENESIKIKTITKEKE